MLRDMQAQMSQNMTAGGYPKTCLIHQTTASRLTREGIVAVSYKRKWKESNIRLTIRTI
jgi:hypothetical protein